MPNSCAMLGSVQATCPAAPGDRCAGFNSESAATLSDVPGSAPKPRQFFVHGITSEGRVFRPSDWAERLAGVLSAYRPGGMGASRDAFIGYSPYVRPIVSGGVKCVLVDERLRALDRMAFDFVINFARDNDLPVSEGCELPDRARPLSADDEKKRGTPALPVR